VKRSCATKLLLLIFVLTSIPALAQNVSPPVSIECSTAGTVQAGKTAKIIIKITPNEDLSLDIYCLVPLGVGPGYAPGLSIMPYREKSSSDPERKANYRLAAGLWSGPLKAGKTKELFLPIRILKKGSYKFIFLADAPGKLSRTESSYTIDLN
jgi:hypothetical protein